jgi:hypothetical protein
MRERTLRALARLVSATFVLLGATTPACGVAPKDAGDDDTSETGSAGSSSSGHGSGGVTGTVEPTPCESAEDCPSGYCVAPYDAGADPQIGPAVCVNECVEAGALDRACIDDASCCGELECNGQALCVEPDAGDTGDTGTTGN